LEGTDVNTFDLARTAYSSAATPIRTHQSTEYDILAQITGRIRTAAARGKSGFNDLTKALHDNAQFWTLLATNVADDNNLLPDMLRGRLFYLAEFSLQHTPKVLNGSADADILLEINTTVMRGLRQQEAAA